MKYILARPERRENLDQLEGRKHPSKWICKQRVQVAFWVQEETGPAEALYFIG